MANKIFSIDFDKIAAYDFANLKTESKGPNDCYHIDGLLCDCVCDMVWTPEPVMAVAKSQNLKSQVISRCIHPQNIKG